MATRAWVYTYTHTHTRTQLTLRVDARLEQYRALTVRWLSADPLAVCKGSKVFRPDDSSSAQGQQKGNLLKINAFLIRSLSGIYENLLMQNYFFN